MKMKKKRKYDDIDEKNKSNENNSKIDDYGRKIWNKEYYKQKVEDSGIDNEDELILQLLTDIKKPVEAPVFTERKLLEERKEVIPLQKNLGKIKILTDKTPKEEQGGYYCKICNCVIKDSQTYLDHINGKNHNRMLGYSMKVKKVTIDDVKKKLNNLKNIKNNKTEITIKDSLEEVQEKIKEIEEMENLRKKKRKEKKLLKKLEKQNNEQKEILDSNLTEIDNIDFEKMGLPTAFI